MTTDNNNDNDVVEEQKYVLFWATKGDVEFDEDMDAYYLVASVTGPDDFDNVYDISLFFGEEALDEALKFKREVDYSPEPVRKPYG